MIRKTLVSAALVVAIVASAFAGFDMYNSKNYTTCLTPTLIADNSAAITNSTTTGADLIGLPGVGCLILSYQCNAGGPAGVLSFKVQTCATTNGTYITWTNAAGQSAWAFTNSSGFAKVQFVPNTVSRYLRTVVTPSGAVTNANAGAILVTE